MDAHYFLIYRHCLREFRLGLALGSGLGLGFTRDRFTVVVAVVLVIDLNKSRGEQVKSSRHSRCYYCAFNEVITTKSASRG